MEEGIEKTYNEGSNFNKVMTLGGLRSKAAALPDLCKGYPVTRVRFCLKFEIHQAEPTFHLVSPSYQHYSGCYVLRIDTTDIHAMRS
jgi:hypothetical protein